MGYSELKVHIEGDFSNEPFPSLLYRILKKRTTGQLDFDSNLAPKKIIINSGSVCLTKNTFSQQSFLEYLKENKIIERNLFPKNRSLQDVNSFSFIKTISQKGILQPEQIWCLLEEHFMTLLFPFFNISEGSYCFHSNINLREEDILISLFIPDLIRKGIKKMNNFDIIDKYLPPDRDFQISQLPAPSEATTFLPHEEYILRVIKNKKNLKEIYNVSQLDEKETKRILFLFACLGVLSVRNSEKTNMWAGSITHVELQNYLNNLNKKSVFIYKFMLKEVGPVAMKILEKSLEEISKYLSPLFKSIRLLPDGRIDTKNISMKYMTPSGKQSKQIILRDLNEILAAEILSAKNILRYESESILIKNLRHIGNV